MKTQSGGSDFDPLQLGVGCMLEAFCIPGRKADFNAGCQADYDSPHLAIIVSGSRRRRFPELSAASFVSGP
ncbi:MAG: hypothetical protein WB555_01130 [Candidatus Korobacteraceae bacterium]